MIGFIWSGKWRQKLQTGRENGDGSAQRWVTLNHTRITLQTDNAWKLRCNRSCAILGRDEITPNYAYSCILLIKWWSKICVHSAHQNKISKSDLCLDTSIIYFCFWPLNTRLKIHISWRSLIIKANMFPELASCRKIHIRKYNLKKHECCWPRLLCTLPYEG